ncbi:QueT transporter family protein [Clostridium formicaceticum]|uniref:Transporter n=1 Tax=Clostridium formicaceticum TaxID=1497 RepID=A0AAC9RM07_9CLOT|nr:QueT transporter family protein [Clostridium formicaceticum]AOY76359.1 transporter [Clostridium formicaceticum]ARE86750.1 Queuosine precursor transporter QueT [Clostridium formicaceticum]
MKKTRFITQAAMIAAIYVVLVEVFKPFSYGMIQVRVAEALTVLPFFTPAAIPGLTVGVIVSNIIGPYGLLDIVLGSLATLIAAYLSYKMPKKLLVPLPPILVNAVIIGAMLYYIFLGTPDEVPLLAIMGWVGLGQLIACYGLGYPLIKILEKYKEKVF